MPTEKVEAGGEDSAILTRDDMLALVESGRELSAQITLDALLQSILARAGQLTDSPDTSVILRHEDREGLYIAAATGDKANWILATFGRHSIKTIPIEGSKAGKVFISGVSIIENKVEGHFRGVDDETKKITESMVCVPLGMGKEIVGVMQILNKRTGNYDEHDLVLLEHFATHAGIAIKNAQLFESVLSHSGVYMRVNDSHKLFDVMREIKKPAHLETLTILFADMRGFTQLCQSLGSPEKIQKHLNEFISMLAHAVIKHEGMVNKFLGDGLMALFRHESHAERAVHAAFEMVDCFAQMKQRWNDASSVQLKFLDVGIGIVTDEVTIGAIGSEAVRDFTAIGSAVNLAAAFEVQARDGKRIIANHLTYSMVKEVVETESLADYILKKARQTVGISHKRYHLKRLVPVIKEKLFISHSHQDRKFVEQQLVTPLGAVGIKTWYAPTAIPKASIWPAEIRKGLAECTCMIVVVSKNSKGSDWVRLEVDIAIGSERMKGRIIPLRLDETPPHSVNEFLMGLQGIIRRTTPDFLQEVINFVTPRALAAGDSIEHVPSSGRVGQGLPVTR